MTNPATPTCHYYMCYCCHWQQLSLLLWMTCSMVSSIPFCVFVDIFIHVLWIFVYIWCSSLSYYQCRTVAMLHSHMPNCQVDVFICQMTVIALKTVELCLLQVNYGWKIIFECVLDPSTPSLNIIMAIAVPPRYQYITLTGRLLLCAKSGWDETL